MQPEGVRLLCVDDDQHLVDLLRYAFEREGFAVQTAHTARDAMGLLRARLPDLVILDVNMPGMNGLQILSWLRTFSRIPVVLLTGRGREDDIIAGLGLGADDYVVKPCSVEVLTNRVKAVLRRTRPHARPVATAGYRIHGALFTPARQEIVGNDVYIKLTPTESRILHLLLLHEGRALSVAYILRHIQRYDAASQPSVVKTHIRNLRTKLGRLSQGAQPIRTVRGVGYAVWLSEGLSTQLSLDA
jgi:two-component system alkaline phosphatase synthesis response regulator PhoP